MVHPDLIWRFAQITPPLGLLDQPTDEVLSERHGPLEARWVDELCGAEDEDEEEDREPSRRPTAHQHRFAGEEFAVDSTYNYHGIGESS